MKYWRRNALRVNFYRNLPDSKSSLSNNWVVIPAKLVSIFSLYALIKIYRKANSLDSFNFASSFLHQSELFLAWFKNASSTACISIDINAAIMRNAARYTGIL